MNLKKLPISIIIIMLLGILMFMPNASYAAIKPEGQELNMGIVSVMDKDNGQDKMGYALSDPRHGGTIIWNIVRYASESSSQPIQDNIYCLKSGVGFAQSTVDSAGSETQNKRENYNAFYDMKTERDNIKAQNTLLKELVEKTISLEGGTSISRYDAILAAMDMFYLPGSSTQEEKTTLLNIVKEQAETLDDEMLFETYPLTTNDIAAVQQAVLWYFTNYEEEEGKYDRTEETNWLYYLVDEHSADNYQSLTNYNPDQKLPQSSRGTARSKQASLLYNYFIDKAKANAQNYSNSGTSTPASVTTKQLAYIEKEDNYIIGPIHIAENKNVTNLPYTIDFVVKNNGTQTSNYQLLDDSQEQVKRGTTVKDLVDKDFYISISKNDVTFISVDINIKYNNTVATLWASTKNTQAQPLAILTRNPQSDSISLTVNPEQEPEKVFDLALRKYITKINGEALTGSNVRVPKVDESTLTNGTTATYRHKKDPVIISTGDKVTYELTIYNEGEKAGRASTIVDQLPTGLRFVQVLNGNFERYSYNETTNTLTLSRKANNTTNLPAYETGSLVNGEGSETIEIECEVTAKPDQENSKILTNVAWISQQIDEDGNVITNQQGADRDSEPSTQPNVSKDQMENYKGKDGNKSNLEDANYFYEGKQDDDDFEKLVLLPEAFDLKLIKRITAVNNQSVPERIEEIDATKLNTLDDNGKMITTADYQLNKDPVSVKKGDIVTYTFRIYNEGTIDGYASDITEDIPEGLQFLWSAKEGTDLQEDTTLTPEEIEAIKFNQDRYWTYTDETLATIHTDFLSRSKEPVEGDGSNLIKAFGRNDGTKTDKNLSYKEVAVKFKVVSENVAGTIIRNEAAITEDTDKEGKTVEDRDSKTDDWKKYEDDEDYDNVILQSFDLALRKFIIAVSKDDTIENTEYLKNEDGSYTRAPIVDTSKLDTEDENGNLITTAVYNHTKEPVVVKRNDYVVYMLRVYNEGSIDGYATEITDHLPPYLEFIDNDFNKQYGWKKSEDGRTITTNYLTQDSQLIKAKTKQENGTIVLSYKEVPIMCQVKDTAVTDENITNIADITKYEDNLHQSIEDRDSQEKNVKLPEDSNLPSYQDDKTGNYVPGQQDDDDFEKVLVKKFDLALRKFITEVNDKNIDTRIPQVKYDEGKITYEHTKVPVDVVSNDVVIYTIRVYNEGEINGYASKISDDLPEGLEFLPEHELNKEMRWVMYDEEGKQTDDVTKATKITTDYLSKEQGEARMKEDEEITSNPNLLKAFKKNEAISQTNPDYKDVKIAFKVTEPNGSKRILVNAAQITDDTDEQGNPIDDEDSKPNEWNEGEDDQDNEYVRVPNFDLSLRKWVTQAIVIQDGKQTVTNTGHKPYDDPEEIVKVEIHRKNLNKVTVKFRYSIRVTNEGEIEGYAKEVTDYIPQGLKFIPEDNPSWKDEGNNVISTRALENTLLKPGEYAEVEVLLTWINNENNMGVMENTAEISEDYNEKGVPDKDSTPDNKKEGEDDIDDAPVMLSIGTGQVRIYFTLGFIVLITISCGVILIKKFVL